MLFKRLTMKLCVFIISKWTFLYFFFYYFCFGNTHADKHTHTHRNVSPSSLFCALEPLRSYRSRAAPSSQELVTDRFLLAQDCQSSSGWRLPFSAIYDQPQLLRCFTLCVHTQRGDVVRIELRSFSCVHQIAFLPETSCCVPRAFVVVFSPSRLALCGFYLLQWRPAHQFALIRFLLAAVSSPCVIWRSPADAKWKRRIFSVCSTTWTTVTADSSAWCPLFRRIRKSVKWRSSSMSLTISWTCSWRWRRTRLSWNRRAHPPPHGPLSHKSTQSR